MDVPAVASDLQQCGSGSIPRAQFTTWSFLMSSTFPQPDKITAALGLMVTSLQLLDEAEAPADVGAHLDLAIHRLRALIAERVHSAHSVQADSNSTAAR